MAGRLQAHAYKPPIPALLLMAVLAAALAAALVAVSRESVAYGGARGSACGGACSMLETTLAASHVLHGCFVVRGFPSLYMVAPEDSPGVDLGTLELIGPAPLEQHRTCVSGMTCEVGALRGRHLSEDRLTEIAGFRLAQDRPAPASARRADVGGRSTRRVAGPSGQSQMHCPQHSPEGRGPSSPNGPNGPLRGSESANIGAPLFRGEHRRCRAPRGAPGARICIVGLRCLQIPI
eukprot:13471707-Alexandrium_andersonii.AAC.2